jgi:hypothetical protein
MEIIVSNDEWKFLCTGCGKKWKIAGKNRKLAAACVNFPKVDE